MKMRKKLSRKKSRKLFTNTAQKVHAKNAGGMPMRGGYRL